MFCHQCYIKLMCKNAKITVLSYRREWEITVKVGCPQRSFFVYPPLPHGYCGFFINKGIVKRGQSREERQGNREEAIDKE